MTLSEHRWAAIGWALLAMVHGTVAALAVLRMSWARAELMALFVIGDLCWALWSATRAERLARAAND